MSDKEGVMGAVDIAVKDLWSEDLERRIRAALQDIKFGTVTLVIQDGKVIQIDKSEKMRIA